MSYYGLYHRLRSVSWRGALLLPGISLVAALACHPPRPDSHSSAGARDTTCSACSDFYEYANKTWLDTATIPASSGNWGVFSVNDARVQTQLHGILQSATAASRSAAQSPAQRKLGLLYSSCMDSARTDTEGIAPLRPALARIDSIDTTIDLVREIARLHNDGLPVVFRFSSEVDRTGDLRYAAIAEPGRQGLVTQDYLKSDSATVARRNEYRQHITRTFALAGESPDSAAHDADRVLAIETALAEASMTRQQVNDETLAEMFRRASLVDLKAATPGFPWDEYLRERDVSTVRSLIVSQPRFFSAVARIATQHPMIEWRAYLRWQLLADASPFLSSAFADESFRFSRLTSGATVQEPRWQRCVREVSTDVPELLGRAYAEHVFPPASKARIDTMVRQLRTVLVERIKSAPWLTEPTRQLALKKADAFGVKIAYPDKWHDYSSLRITPSPFVIERTEANRFESARMISRIGQSPDSAEWDFHYYYHFVPQSPTAWANWSEIIFPAGYLQPPIYDSTATLAANYGAIGVVIGHEMTHLFTADGGDIDAAGRIRHWWTPTDSARFSVIQNRLVQQYNRYTVLDSATHLNGRYTMDENLADVGGVELAFAALERSVAASPQQRVRGDTTPEMRFFLSYARARVSKSRPAYLRNQIATDGHSPSKFRVNGPLSDFPEFAKTFGCKPGDGMLPPVDAQAHIW